MLRQTVPSILTKLTLQELFRVRTAGKIMEFNEVLNRRYSCRAFSARQVEQEKVDRILEAFRMAPTAVNKQP